MPVYYPSLVCNLKIRFDEALLNGEVPDPVSAKQLADDPGGPPGEAGDLPASMDGTKGELSKVLSIMPKDASVELQGYRQANKFSLTFAFRDFPFDPRALRAVGVEIYVGVVSAEDFDRGMRGEKINGRAASVLAANRDNLMMVGTVDDICMEHSDKGSEVTMSGRGLQGIFLDGKLDPATLKGLDLKQPIHMVVGQILSRAPAGARIPIEVNDDEWPGGVVPAPCAPAVLTRMNTGTSGEDASRPLKGDANKMSFWDAITQFCFLVGAVPYFDGYQLKIRPAKSLYEQKKSTATPFKGEGPRTVQTTGGPFQMRYRRMIYGRNLLNFKLERKLGGQKVPTVKCVSIDPDQAGTEKLLEAEWPVEKDGAKPDRVKAAKRTSVDPSGQEAQQEVLFVPVPGIKDKDRLRLIARNIYEEIGRGEMGGSVSTKDLASLGGDNEDADIVRLRPGDAVEFLVNAAGLEGIPPVVSELNNLVAESPAGAVARIAKLFDGDTKLAEVLVGTARGSYKGLQSTFRVGNVRYTWSAASGIAVDFDFQNYVEARYDVVDDTDNLPEQKPTRISVFDSARGAGR